MFIKQSYAPTARFSYEQPLSCIGRTLIQHQPKEPQLRNNQHLFTTRFSNLVFPASLKNPLGLRRFSSTSGFLLVGLLHDLLLVVVTGLVVAVVVVVAAVVVVSLVVVGLGVVVSSDAVVVGLRDILIRRRRVVVGCGVFVVLVVVAVVVVVGFRVVVVVVVGFVVIVVGAGFVVVDVVVVAAVLSAAALAFLALCSASRRRSSLRLHFRRFCAALKETQQTKTRTVHAAKDNRKSRERRILVSFQDCFDCVVLKR